MFEGEIKILILPLVFDCNHAVCHQKPVPLNNCSYIHLEMFSMVIQIKSFENSDLPLTWTAHSHEDETGLHPSRFKDNKATNRLENLMTELPVHYEAEQGLEIMSLSSTFVHRNKDTQACFVIFITFLSTLKLNFDISNMHKNINKKVHIFNLNIYIYVTHLMCTCAHIPLYTHICFCMCICIYVWAWFWDVCLSVYKLYTTIYIYLGSCICNLVSFSWWWPIYPLQRNFWNNKILEDTFPVHLFLHWQKYVVLHHYSTK